MSAEQFLDRSAFDDIIASLENLLSQVQALVNSLDPLNDAEVIADFQALADNLAAILNVEGNTPNINALAAIDTQIAALAAIAADITTNAENIADIQNAFQNAQDAIAAATASAASEQKSMEWATNPVDDPVEISPNRFSSIHWATKADESAQIALGVANFKGRWSDATGAGTTGETYLHEDTIWLLLEDLADITTSEPGDENADWKSLNLSIVNQSLMAFVTEYPAAEWTIAGGESEIDIEFEGAIEVARNGSLLSSDNYTHTGSTLTLDFELTAGDIVAVRKLLEEGAFAENTTDITFVSSTVYNTPDVPGTGSITHFSLSGAKIGIVQKIYHEDSSVTFPAEWVNIGYNEYIPDTLNIIFAEYVNDNRIEYWII